MERHHRSLRKAGENGVGRAEAGLGPKVGEETGDDRLGGLGADEPREVAVRLEVERKPLIAERIAGADLGRVGRNEDRVGEAVAPELAERDEITSVRAVAMQQDYEAFRIAG